MMADNLLRVAVTAAFLLAGSVSAEQEPVVATKAGHVRGTTLKSLMGNEFFSFKGSTFLCYSTFKKVFNCHQLSYEMSLGGT